MLALIENGPIREHLTSESLPLKHPIQGSIGNCWLWSTVVVLNHWFPWYFTSIIHIHPEYATICFPRDVPERVWYTFGSPAQTIDISDFYWSMLSHAMSAKRSKLEVDHSEKSDILEGGLVSEALHFLSPFSCRPPVIVPEQHVYRTISKCICEGLFFGEQEREGGLHPLAILGVDCRGYVVAWDPWGWGLYLHPSELTVLFYRWCN